MIPKEKVLTCSPTAEIRTAKDSMIEDEASAIIVLFPDRHHVPLGIVTKNDMMEALGNGHSLNEPVKNIMRPHAETCSSTMSGDEAARVLEHNGSNHAVVVDDENQHYQGLISKVDVAKQYEELISSSPTTPAEEIYMENIHQPTVPLANPSKMGDSFQSYIDQVMVIPYFD